MDLLETEFIEWLYTKSYKNLKIVFNEIVITTTYVNLLLLLPSFTNIIMS